MSGQRYREDAAAAGAIGNCDRTAVKSYDLRSDRQS